MLTWFSISCMILKNVFSLQDERAKAECASLDGERGSQEQREQRRVVAGGNACPPAVSRRQRGVGGEVGLDRFLKRGHETDRRHHPSKSA